MNRTLNEVKESVTLVFRRSVGGRNRNRRRLRWEYTYHDWGIARRPVWNEIRREGGNEVIIITRTHSAKIAVLQTRKPPKVAQQMTVRASTRSQGSLTSECRFSTLNHKELSQP